MGMADRSEMPNSCGHPGHKDLKADVVVAGAAQGGLCAAISAAEEGARVILLEISSRTGGGSAFSGGFIHCMGLKTWEDYQEYTEGLHDSQLARIYVETFRNTFIPWLSRINADVSFGKGKKYGSDLITAKKGHVFRRNRDYFDSLETAFKSFGGILLLKTKALKLLTDDKGRVIGLRASSWESSPIEENQTCFDVKAGAVILATGNFFCNPEMLQKYIGPDADQARPSGVPYSTGEGLLMAQAVGAALSGSMSTWSGGLQALSSFKPVQGDPEAFEKVLATCPPERFKDALFAGLPPPPRWIPVMPDMGPTYAILINLNGRRFIDEASHMDAKYPRLPQAVLKQRGGKAFMIADHLVYEKVSRSKESIDAILAEGGKVIVAGSMEEFGLKMKNAGVYRANLLRTINRYNKAIDEGKAEEEDPPRSDGFHKISSPPFYAVPVTASIYHTFGGLAINHNAAVVDRQKKSIPGLYAAPPLAGGIFNSVYCGAMGLAGTFGYIAGKSATKAVSQTAA